MGSSSAQQQPVFTSPTAYRAPGTRRQETLCLLFAEALGVDRVGLDDSFFDLGGQSLNGLRLIKLITKELGRELSIDELFDYPTVAELDEYLRD